MKEPKVYKDDFCECTTIRMEKFLDCDDPSLEIECVKKFVYAFALWCEFDLSDMKNRRLRINISYVNDHFFKEELLATIKFFMQFRDYLYLKHFPEMKPICDIGQEES